MTTSIFARRLCAFLLFAALPALPACMGNGNGGGGGGAAGGTGAEGQVQAGAYECYTFSGGRLEPRPGLNFRITGAGTYADVGGSGGSYAFDAGNAVVSFNGAALDGQRAKYDGQAKPKTLTFLDAQGNLGDSCDHQD